MSEFYRIRDRRTNSYYDDDSGEFNSSVGKIWTDETKVRRSYDKLAIGFNRGGVSFYEFYADTEIVVSTLYDVGTLSVQRRMTREDDDGR